MKLSNKNALAAAIGALGTVWCFGIYAIANYTDLAVPCIGSIVCEIVAIALSILFLTALKAPADRQAVEVGALSVIFTIAYVLLSAIVNTALVFYGHGSFNKILLLCNMLLCVVYTILFFSAERYQLRLSGQLQRTEQKIADPVNISAKLGELLAIADDEGVRQELLKLKETVDYSSNVSTLKTYESEQAMAAQLDELMNMIATHSSSEEIQEKIRKAAITWKTRSGVSAH